MFELVIVVMLVSTGVAVHNATTETTRCKHNLHKCKVQRHPTQKHKRYHNDDGYLRFKEPPRRYHIQRQDDPTLNELTVGGLQAKRDYE